MIDGAQYPGNRPDECIDAEWTRRGYPQLWVGCRNRAIDPTQLRLEKNGILRASPRLVYFHPRERVIDSTNPLDIVSHDRHSDTKAISEHLIADQHWMSNVLVSLPS
jgi:hypothetical protein